MAAIFPALVRDLCSISTYRNLPSGDQTERQTPEQIRRGDPPPVGTAIDALVSPAPGSGVMAMIQRRSGEIFMIVGHDPHVHAFLYFREQELAFIQPDEAGGIREQEARLASQRRDRIGVPRTFVDGGIGDPRAIS
jgi:hypothetical protein